MRIISSGRTFRPAPAAALVMIALLVPSLAAQNRDHPGKVYVDKKGWISPEEAVELGWFEYRGWWFPEKMRKKLDSWEKEDARHTDWKDARKVKTKHYRVTTNLPRYLLECEIEPFLDELYRTYVDVFNKYFGLSGRSANQSFIKIYYGYRDYGLNELEDGKPSPRTIPGYFMGDELVVYYDRADPSIFYGTVFHEGAHQFIAAVLPAENLPLWLEEALAVYFEGCTYSRAEKKIRVGFSPPDRARLAQSMLQRLKPGEYQGLAERMIFSVPEERFEAENYAMAWSFVYYLINRDGGRHRKAFARFLKEVNRSGNRGIPEIFKKTTGELLADIEGEWREFILGLEVESLPKWASLHVEEPDPEVDIRSGDFVWSFDGVEIYGLMTIQTMWKKRPLDRPVELRLIRKVPVEGFEKYRQELVTLTVPPESPLKLNFGVDPNRGYNLRD